MRHETILREAEFNPKVTSYWLLSGTIICIFTIVGILLLPIWLIVGKAITGKYLARMSCTLTDRSLIIRKGMFNRIEKTVPLEKITDLGLFQGPIMRHMDLKGFKVETAGGGGATTGYLVQLIGIVNTDEFRDAVLAQRDILQGQGVLPTPPAPAPATPSSTQAPESVALLREIRDSLKAIESRGTDQDR